jgi:hypothetical protein
MFKGYARKVIVVRDTGSNMFERAYFIVRDGQAPTPIRNMTEEAPKIIDDPSAQMSIYPKRSIFFFFSLGLALASVSFTLAVLLAL